MPDSYDSLSDNSKPMPILATLSCVPALVGNDDCGDVLVK